MECCQSKRPSRQWCHEPLTAACPTMQPLTATHCDLGQVTWLLCFGPPLCKTGNVSPTIETAGTRTCEGFYQTIARSIEVISLLAIIIIIITIIILRIIILNKDVIIRYGGPGQITSQ